MKMVKSLLLGSAAGLVAIAGAQAADLPVKAKPVEYVKICSAYGAGFYYIPGTDTCLKVGGYAMAEWNINAGGTHTPYVGGANARNNREDTMYYQSRIRSQLSADARTQTEYGTLRSYISFGLELNSATNFGTIDTTYRGITFFTRAFIQFAGLTIGKTQSFFDFYAYGVNYTNSPWNAATTHGINLLAYTVQFGGGISGTISFEDNQHRRTGMWYAALVGGDPFPGFGQFANIPNYGHYAAQRFPDIVANLRVDQPWGSAQVMAAVHDASGGCMFDDVALGAGTRCQTPTGGSAHANDATGFAVGGGVMFNLPWAKGDQFWAEGRYAVGAASYLGFNKFNALDFFSMYGVGTQGALPGDIGSFGVGAVYDGIYGVGATLAERQTVRLSEGWQFVAGIQHFWTPSLRTSLFGGVSALSYPGTQTDVTTAKGKFCNGRANAAGPRLVANPLGQLDCNPDFAVYGIGTRTIWSPVANLDIGVEVLYTKLDQNFVGSWLLPANGGRPAGFYTARDQDTWSGVLRFQRNFWP